MRSGKGQECPTARPDGKNALLPPQLAAAILGLLAAFPLPAGAWSGKIHRAIALMAADRLTPAATVHVREILGSGYGLADVAACADTIKRQPTVCGPMHLAVDRRSSSWHFVNVPLGAAPAAGELLGYCRNHGRNDACSVAQIPRQLAVLRDPSSSQGDKQLALMFVVHLVGDLHQPLHNATDGDAGGNGKLVNFLGARKRVSLHHLWDNLLQTDAAAKKQSPEAYAQLLEADTQQKDITSWMKGDVVTAAALESYAIARDRIYPAYYGPDGRRPGRSYQETLQPIAVEQLEKAGVRLAFLLNETWP